MNAGKSCIHWLPRPFYYLLRYWVVRILVISGVVTLLSGCSLPSNQPEKIIVDQDLLASVVAQTLSVYPSPSESFDTPTSIITIESPTITAEVSSTIESIESQPVIIITPSPTEQVQPVDSPTSYPLVKDASFSASFSQWNFCNSRQTVIFKIKNTGGVPFDSMGLTIKIPATGINLKDTDKSNKPFMPSKDACPPGTDQLLAGTTAFIGTSLKVPVAILQLRAVITLCTEDGLKGECLTKTVNFRIK